MLKCFRSSGKDDPPKQNISNSKVEKVASGREPKPQETKSKGWFKKNKKQDTDNDKRSKAYGQITTGSSDSELGVYGTSIQNQLYQTQGFPVIPTTDDGKQLDARANPSPTAPSEGKVTTLPYLPYIERPEDSEPEQTSPIVRQNKYSYSAPTQNKVSQYSAAVARPERPVVVCDADDIKVDLVPHEAYAKEGTDSDDNKYFFTASAAAKPQVPPPVSDVGIGKRLKVTGPPATNYAEPDEDLVQSSVSSLDSSNSRRQSRLDRSSTSSGLSDPGEYEVYGTSGRRGPSKNLSSQVDSKDSPPIRIGADLESTGGAQSEIESDFVQRRRRLAGPLDSNPLLPTPEKKKPKKSLLSPDVSKKIAFDGDGEVSEEQDQQVSISDESDAPDSLTQHIELRDNHASDVDGGSVGDNRMSGGAGRAAGSLHVAKIISDTIGHRENPIPLENDGEGYRDEEEETNPAVQLKSLAAAAAEAAVAFPRRPEQSTTETVLESTAPAEHDSLERISSSSFANPIYKNKNASSEEKNEEEEKILPTDDAEESQSIVSPSEELPTASSLDDDDAEEDDATSEEEEPQESEQVAAPATPSLFRKIHVAETIDPEAAVPTTMKTYAYLNYDVSTRPLATLSEDATANDGSLDDNLSIGQRSVNKEGNTSFSRTSSQSSSCLPDGPRGDSTRGNMGGGDDEHLYIDTETTLRDKYSPLSNNNNRNGGTRSSEAHGVAPSKLFNFSAPSHVSSSTSSADWGSSGFSGSAYKAHADRLPSYMQPTQSYKARFTEDDGPPALAEVISHVQSQLRSSVTTPTPAQHRPPFNNRLISISKPPPHSSESVSPEMPSKIPLKPPVPKFSNASFSSTSVSKSVSSIPTRAESRPQSATSSTIQSKPKHGIGSGGVWSSVSSLPKQTPALHSVRDSHPANKDIREPQGSKPHKLDMDVMKVYTVTEGKGYNSLVSSVVTNKAVGSSQFDTNNPAAAAAMAVSTPVSRPVSCSAVSTSMTTLSSAYNAALQKAKGETEDTKTQDLKTSSAVPAPRALPRNSSTNTAVRSSIPSVASSVVSQSKSPNAKSMSGSLPLGGPGASKIGLGAPSADVQTTTEGTSESPAAMSSSAPLSFTSQATKSRLPSFSTDFPPSTVGAESGKPSFFDYSRSECPKEVASVLRVEEAVLFPVTFASASVFTAAETAAKEVAVASVKSNAPVVSDAAPVRTGTVFTTTAKAETSTSTTSSVGAPVVAEKPNAAQAPSFAAPLRAAPAPTPTTVASPKSSPSTSTPSQGLVSALTSALPREAEGKRSSPPKVEAPVKIEAPAKIEAPKVEASDTAPSSPSEVAAAALATSRSAAAKTLPRASSSTSLMSDANQSGSSQPVSQAPKNTVSGSGAPPSASASAGAKSRSASSLPVNEWRLVRLKKAMACSAAHGTIVRDGQVFKCSKTLDDNDLAAVINQQGASSDAGSSGKLRTWVFCPRPECMESQPEGSGQLPPWPKQILLMGGGVKVTRIEFDLLKNRGMEVVSAKRVSALAAAAASSSSPAP